MIFMIAHRQMMAGRLKLELDMKLVLLQWLQFLPTLPQQTGLKLFGQILWSEFDMDHAPALMIHKFLSNIPMCM